MKNFLIFLFLTLVLAGCVTHRQQPKQIGHYPWADVHFDWTTRYRQFVAKSDFATNESHPSGGFVFLTKILC